jgi:phage major head subunit gpT-like protein
VRTNRRCCIEVTYNYLSIEKIQKKLITLVCIASSRHSNVLKWNGRRPSLSRWVDKVIRDLKHVRRN